MEPKKLKHELLKSEPSYNWFGAEIRKFIYANCPIVKDKKSFEIFDNASNSFIVEYKRAGLWCSEWYMKYDLKTGDFIMVEIVQNKIIIYPLNQSKSDKRVLHDVDTAIDFPIIDKIRRFQNLSDSPTEFEKIITTAFEELGFKTRHIGGPNQPDILLEIYDVVIDTKSTKEGVISERAINFDSIDRYKEKHNSKYSCIVAPGFAEGNLRQGAQKRNIVLIETEAICKLLENHYSIHEYTTDNIIDLLFQKDFRIITPKEIPFPDKRIEERIPQISSILKVLRNFENNMINSFSAEQIRIALIGQGKKYELNDIENCLNFLSSPPFDILKQTDSDFSFSISMGIIFKKINILLEAYKIFNRE